jgi:hypothetical protein
LHKWASYACGIVVLIHVVMHWRYITAVFKRALTPGRLVVVRQAFAVVSVCAIVAMSTFGMVFSAKPELVAALFPLYANISPATSASANNVSSSAVAEGEASGSGAAGSAATPQAGDSQSGGYGRGSKGKGYRSSNAASGSSSAAAPDSSTVPDNSTAPSQQSPEISGGTPTLDEYLAGFTCTICHKLCPLSAPRCGKADGLIAQATSDYNALYAQIGLRINCTKPQ